mmetsp:Transcript_99029/g.308609  ORF Transcript_99029/g.308609 Transcript_99029/m.308609 type:complete len:252 (-) Transcript_99029:141-896(-)
MAEVSKTRPDHVFATDLPADITEDALKTAFGQYGSVTWCRLFPGMGKMAALLQFASPDEAAFLVENMNGAILHELLPGPVTLCFSEQGEKKKKGSGGKGKAQTPVPQRTSPYGGGRPGTELVPVHVPAQPQFAKVQGKGFGKGSFSIIDLKKELQTDEVLPGGQWTNDDGALHIGGLPLDTTDKDVYEIFAPFGAIATRGLKAMANPDGSCTGVAFVNYLDPESARAAISALNGRACKDGRILHVKPKKRK